MNRLLGFKMITYLSLRLPRPLLYLAARAFSAMNYHLDHAKREAVLDNLSVILGPTASQKRIRFEAKWTVRNFGKYLAEFFGFERFGGRFIDTYVDIVGKEYVDEALSLGRGAILNTGHLSNWEIGAATYARKGYHVMGVAQLHPEPELNDYFRRQRGSRGYHVIPTEGSFRRCIEHLRQNKVVCFVADRDIGVGGIEVEFFGRPCLFPQGPARIALASGAPLIPGFVIRRPNDAFTVCMEPPVPVPERGDRHAKAHVMTQEFARLIEGYIRRFPAQWGVFFKVWSDGDQPAQAGGDFI